MKQSNISPTDALRKRLRLNTSCTLLALSVWVPMFVGCWPSQEDEVVIYCALDREFSEPILERFEVESGIVAKAKYDIESTKTVGLVAAIIEEQSRPRCDVFWNNEILHTMRLENLGLLEAYEAPGAKDFPANYQSPSGTWYGLAARARVLIVNTELLPDPAEWPSSIHDLADPKWQGRCAMAKPSFGTTATHCAVLFAYWEEETAEQFFRQVQANADIVSGNKQVALGVARGEYAFGITDTDDAIVEMEKGMPVEIVFPDQGEDELGTLFIPNTICVIRGAAHQEQAQQLIDYLLQPKVEIALAHGASAQFPVNPTVPEKSRVDPGETIRWMDADFSAAASAWDSAATFVGELFQSSATGRQ